MVRLTLSGPPADTLALEHASTYSDRSQRLLKIEIDFVPNADFDSPGRQPDASVDGLLQSMVRSAGKLPTHQGRLGDSEVLSTQEETALFREMNYSKYRAALLRQQIEAGSEDLNVLDSIEHLLSRAQRIRDHILEANMRLVMSIVKKFVTPQHAFDDLLSEGIYTLMQAVEKFDYDRGFRFSTYAYRSIARQAYRCVKSARKEQARLVRDADEWAFEQDPNRPVSSLHDRLWSHLRERLVGLLEQLDRREQFIIRSRYALGPHRKTQSLQVLADKLDLSKERVRQLEHRAVDKLREMTTAAELDELFGASLF